MPFVSTAYRKLFNIFLIISIFSTYLNAKYDLRIFNFNEDFPIDCSDPNDPCYSPEELVKLALNNSMESKERIQMLFQVNNDIKIQMGKLMPQLNTYGVASTVLDLGLGLDMIIPLVGFIFPSRWLQWKASKMIRNAEKESLAATFGNIALHIQHLYFDIQQQIWSIHVLNFYMSEIDKLVIFLQQQKREENVDILDDDIAALENIKARMVYDRAFIDALSAVLPQLATAIAYSPNVDWSKLKLVPYKIRSLIYSTERPYLDFWPQALELSPEVKSIEHLLAAAKKNTKSTFFNCLDPESGENFGFGFGSRIKNARSKVEILNIQLQRTKMKLSNDIQYSLNNYNDSVISFPAIEEAVISLEKMRVIAEQIINDKNIPFDINKIARYFDFAERQALRHISSQFVFRIAEADLERYTWNSPIYKIVQDYIDNEVELRLKEEKKKQSFRYAIKHKFGKSSKKNNSSNNI